MQKMHVGMLPPGKSTARPRAVCVCCANAVGAVANALAPLTAAGTCLLPPRAQENEHLHNTEGYRRIEVIPLHFETPLHKSDNASDEEKRQRGGRLLISMEVGFFVLVVVALTVAAVLLPAAARDGNATRS